VKQPSKQWNINTKTTKNSWCGTNLLRLVTEELNHTLPQNNKFSSFPFVQHQTWYPVLRCVIRVVFVRLMGRVLQSVTQQSISNWWYVLNQSNYMFWPVEAIISFA